MDSLSDSSQPDGSQSGADFSWLDQSRFRRFEQACEDLTAIWQCGATPDLLEVLKQRLPVEFERLSDLDSAVSNLSRFVLASRSPVALLALFERDDAALGSLLQVFATSQTLANRLIADPESFDLMRASDGQPARRRYLVDELLGEFSTIDSESRAIESLRKFTTRELTRIAYGEFVRGLSPDHVGRQLAYVADAVIEAALQFASNELAETQGLPQRIDGEIPKVAVIGLGSLGGEESSYASALRVMFLYDAIDEKNPSQREYYRALVRRVIQLVCPHEPGGPGDSAPSGEPGDLRYQIDLSRGPHRKDSLICSIDDAVQMLETKNRSWQRVAMIKARAVAGAPEVAEQFLQRIQPWVYHRFISRSDFDEVRSLRRKLERRASELESSSAEDSGDVVRTAGGRQDIELTVQFLQLLHGGDLADVRIANTNEAIIALEKTGCLLHTESELLAGNYARLCRLHHQLSVMFGRDTTRLPDDPALCKQLAWQLGIRDQSGTAGDLDRFQAQLNNALAVNRKMINHLMIDSPDQGVGEGVAASLGASRVSVETELILDPEPDATLVSETLTSHGLARPERAMDDLLALSTESVAFLSPRRCRHFFASVAPALLSEVSKTPFPDQTLQSLVAVTDSLGAKATLWELLGTNPPTLQLMVRLCAAAPYLSGILTNNPGMIDELIDSLLMNRLPSNERLDAHSIGLCYGAADIDLILHGFKNSAHLMIGVRDILDMESIESTHRALSDTAEACLRRIIDHEQEKLAQQFGDPVDQSGNRAELVALALGKFGGREPNYHSDLDVIFLYSAMGDTRRRVGGRRSTTSNHHFFNQLAQRVLQRVNHSGENGRLYELDGRLRPTGDEGIIAVSIDDFLKRFRQDIAPLWQRLALCKARCVSGSRLLRDSTNKQITEVIAHTRWHSRMASEIRLMRERTQETASQENLKRGDGGTVDVEVIAQMLTLKHAAESPQVIQTGTIDALDALSAAGHLPEQQAITLANGYRTLRGIEARLRLLNTPERHELPTDSSQLKNLAFLLGETDPAMILAQAKQARHNNRRVFDEIFGSQAS